jgi:hypothetical protein
MRQKLKSGHSERMLHMVIVLRKDAATAEVWAATEVNLHCYE